MNGALPPSSYRIRPFSSFILLPSALFPHAILKNIITTATASTIATAARRWPRK
jgi:hypothetical protein